MLLKNKFLIISLFSFFLFTCTETPTETKIVGEKIQEIKIKKITFEDKAKFKSFEIFVNKGHIKKPLKFNKSNKIMIKNFNTNNDFVEGDEKYKRNVLSLDNKMILEAPIYEIQTEFVEKTIETKKLSQYQHNPIGALSSSIIMLGSIEAWCLLEWASNILPGKQKNIFLKDCKEFYLGNKKNTSEIDQREKSVKDTGQVELIEKKLDKSNITISAYNNTLAVYKNLNFNNVIYISDFIDEMPGAHYLQTPRDIRVKIQLDAQYKGKKLNKTSYFIIPKEVIEYELNMKLLYPNN